MALLLSKKVTISTKWEDFANVFSKESGVLFPERIDIHKHTFEWVDDKKSTYNSIYSPSLVKLEILKTNIKTNLANSFIQHSKSPARALTLFVQKTDSSFCLCVDY